MGEKFLVKLKKWRRVQKVAISVGALSIADVRALVEAEKHVAETYLLVREAYE